MRPVDLLRRRLIATLVVLPAFSGPAKAEPVTDIDWVDLVPEGDAAIPESLRGLIAHEKAPLLSQQPVSTGIRAEWAGKRVRLPGYVVPLDYAGEGITSFILVPFVGACVHVPPPPANQLVLVSVPRPYASKGLFEPVRVTGRLGVAALSTDLAEIGYTLSAERIEAHSG